MVLWKEGGSDLTARQVALALAQFPAYGLAIGMAYRNKRARRIVVVATILLHLTAAILCSTFSK